MGWGRVPDLGLGAAAPPQDAHRPLDDDEVAEVLELLRVTPAFGAAMERLERLGLAEPHWHGIELTSRDGGRRRRFVTGRTATVDRRWAAVSCWLGEEEPRVVLDVYEASS